MSFKWNPNAEAVIEKTVADGIEAHARPKVEGTVCPTHGEHPKLVRRGNDVTIEGACCKAVAQAAAKNADLGDVVWPEQTE